MALQPTNFQGSIAIDSIVASTYTAAVEPAIAHGILLPLRMIFNGCKISFSMFANAGFGHERRLPQGAGEL